MLKVVIGMYIPEFEELIKVCGFKPFLALNIIKLSPET